MNTDLSVAPEIAQLADPFVPAQPVAARPRTDGRIAGDLADLAATPERWWDLVRFDHDGPVRVPLPDAPGTWLLVLPPGATADCDCQQATALAGEAVEAAEGRWRRHLAAAAAPWPRPRARDSARPASTVPSGQRLARPTACAPSETATRLRCISPEARTASANSQAGYGTMGRPSASYADDGVTPREYPGKSSPGVTRRHPAVGQNWERLIPERTNSHD